MKFDKYTEHKAFAVFTLSLLAIVWGSSFILMKKGLESFDPIQVGTIRIMFACLVLLPIAVKNISTHFKKDWKKFLTVGLIGNFTPAILFAYAETGISSSLAGILNALTPIFTLIVGTLAFATKINRWQVLGLVIGFAGSVALTFIGVDGGLGNFNHFAVAVIVATLGYGISINLLKKFFQNLPTPVLTSLIFFSVGPIAVIYLLTTDFIPTIINKPESWSSLFYIFLLGAVGTSFALILFNKLIQQTTAVFASTVTYLIPIIAVAWGILDGETLYPIHFIGMAMIISGVYIVNWKK